MRLHIRQILRQHSRSLKLHESENGRRPRGQKRFWLMAEETSLQFSSSCVCSSFHVQHREACRQGCKAISTHEQPGRTLLGCDPSRITDTYRSSPKPRLNVASPPRPVASAILRMHELTCTQDERLTNSNAQSWSKTGRDGQWQYALSSKRTCGQLRDASSRGCWGTQALQEHPRQYSRETRPAAPRPRSSAPAREVARC